MSRMFVSPDIYIMPAHVSARLLDPSSPHVSEGVYKSLCEAYDDVDVQIIDLPSLGLKWHFRGERRRSMMSQGLVDINTEVMQIMDPTTFARGRLMYDM